MNIMPNSAREETTQQGSLVKVRLERTLERGSACSSNGPLLQRPRLSKRRLRSAEIRSRKGVKSKPARSRCTGNFAACI